MDIPLHIEYPCINIIGTTQTDRIKELFTSGFQQNGLLDRFLFCYSHNTTIPLWDKQSANKSTKKYFDEWEQILNKIISMPFDEDESKWKIIPFTVNARDYFFDWRNKSIQDMFEFGVEDAARNRMMKTHLNVARIALAMQLLRWACGEAKDSSVDLWSLKAAIRISDYFEDCYNRIYDFIKVQLLKSSARMLYEGVGNKFTTAQALKVGQEKGMSVRNVKRMLTILLDLKMLKKISHGRYQKMIDIRDIHP